MSTVTTARPGTDEYREYFAAYIGLVPDGDITELLDSQINELHDVLDPLTDQQARAVHPPYLWSIKQVVGHLIDVERVFGNRCHRFSSGDPQGVPGFDQDLYVTNCDLDSPSLASLVKELECCRFANILMFQRLRPESWDLRGVADGHPISVRALAWILAGHIVHHLEIVRKRLG